MPLRIPTRTLVSINSPEELFQLLKGRNPDIKNLWSQQADMLREYDKKQSLSDVSLELPTGSGKTLIALLIAEYRRRKFGERVIYLCPTRQLAKQVNRQSEQYGIDTRVLVGPQADYDPASFGDFATAATIGIATYSGIFNTNPRINNAQCVILDDAHAAENYVSKLWNLSISRKSTPDVYKAVLDVIERVLPESLLHSLRSEDVASHERAMIGKVIQSDYWKLIPSIRDVISARANKVNELEYPWSMINEHLHACNLFASWDEICIRPFFSPSQTHPPFWNAKQRIYLSATLGESGDLERALGVEKIERLPAAKGWDRNSQGRRLIIAPNFSLGQIETEQLAAVVVNQAVRTLVLCPNNYSLGKFEKSLQDNGVKKNFLRASHIENDLNGFVTSNSVLMLANRYDGIDLPDDSCRIEIIDELPDATNLQERFLSEKLGATSVLRERIRTRLTQALGRCTRNDTDFAVLILIGETLAAAIADSGFRKNFHPDTQLEFEVAIENSKDASIQSMLELIHLFLSEPQTRSEIDEYVIGNRSDRQKMIDPNATALLASVQYELSYMYSLWKGEYIRAYDKARIACDNLAGGTQLRPYQALWYYFAASLANYIADSQGKPEYVAIHNDLISRAQSCSDKVSWFSILNERTEDVGEADEIDLVAIENSSKAVIRLGTIGRRFEGRLNDIYTKLSGKEAKAYESGLQMFGELLGFNAVYPGDEAAPDGIWDIDRKIVITFEAKSDEGEQKKIPAKDVRQAKLHEDWVRTKYQLPTGTLVIPVLLTYQASIEANAKPLLDGLRYMNCKAFLDIVNQAFTAIRSVRLHAVPTNELDLRLHLIQEFSKANLLSKQFVGQFEKMDEKFP